MPKINAQVFYKLPPKQEALEARAVVNLEEGLAQLKLKFESLRIKNINEAKNELDTLEQELFNRHLHLDSNYLHKIELLQGLIHIFSALESTSLLMYQNIILQLSEGAVACTQGMHIRVFQILKELNQPASLDEILYAIRSDFIDTLARHKSSNVHDYNRFFSLAFKLGLGVYPLDQNDPYRGHQDDESISRYLLSESKQQLTPFYILDELSHKLKLLLELQFEYQGLSQQGYPLGTYNRIYEYLIKILNLEPHELTYDKVFITNENDLIIDLNWAFIHEELMQHMWMHHYAIVSPEEQAFIKTMLEQGELSKATIVSVLKKNYFYDLNELLAFIRFFRYHPFSPTFDVISAFINLDSTFNQIAFQKILTTLYQVSTTPQKDCYELINHFMNRFDEYGNTPFIYALLTEEDIKPYLKILPYLNPYQVEDLFLASNENGLGVLNLSLLHNKNAVIRFFCNSAPQLSPEVLLKIYTLKPKGQIDNLLSLALKSRSPELANLIQTVVACSSSKTQELIFLDTDKDNNNLINLAIFRHSRQLAIVLKSLENLSAELKIKMLSQFNSLNSSALYLATFNQNFALKKLLLFINTLPPHQAAETLADLYLSHDKDDTTLSKSLNKLIVYFHFIKFEIYENLWLMHGEKFKQLFIKLYDKAHISQHYAYESLQIKDMIELNSNISIYKWYWSKTHEKTQFFKMLFLCDLMKLKQEIYSPKVPGENKAYLIHQFEIIVQIFTDFLQSQNVGVFQASLSQVARETQSEIKTFETSSYMFRLFCCRQSVFKPILQVLDEFKSYKRQYRIHLGEVSDEPNNSPPLPSPLPQGERE